MLITVARTYTFEAAHRLPRTPVGHKCHTMHGHSYRVEVELTGEPDPRFGWFIDFADIDHWFGVYVHAIVDHQTLNEIPGLENATLEVFAPWMWAQLAPRLSPWLSRIVIHEGHHSRVEFRGAL